MLDKRNRVLVHTSPKTKNHILGSLQGTQYAAEFFYTMQGMLERLHSGRIAAILIEYEEFGVDVLEAILNIRDMNKSIPVIVLGKSVNDQAERYLASDPWVFRIETNVSGGRLKADCLRLLKEVRTTQPFLY
jgi:CheY-like chemotaxis protein